MPRNGSEGGGGKKKKKGHMSSNVGKEAAVSAERTVRWV